MFVGGEQVLIADANVDEMPRAVDEHELHALVVPRVVRVVVVVMVVHVVVAAMKDATRVLAVSARTLARQIKRSGVVVVVCRLHRRCSHVLVL